MTTIPLRDRARNRLARRADARGTEHAAPERARQRSTATLVAIGGLAVIVLGSLLVVILAANRPGYLSPSTSGGFYPGWLAGPLGGLWPSFPRGSTILRDIFTGSVLVMSASYILCVREAPKLGASLVIGAIVLLQVIFLLSPPLTLTDVFNYIDYARMEVVHHLNPYTTIPVIEPHSDPAYALSNWHELLSPYGPLFTIVMFAFVSSSIALSFWLVKGLLAVTSLACLLLVWKCARLLGRDPVRAIAFVGLNPLVLLWGLGGVHNDYEMMCFILLACYLLLRARAGGAPIARRTRAEAGAASPGAEAGAASPRAEANGVSPRAEANGVSPRAEANDAPRPLGNGAVALSVAGGVADANGGSVSSPPLNWAPETAGGARAGRAARAGSAWLSHVRAALFPPAWLELIAGASLAAAVFIKASGAIVVPVIVVALAREPRRAAQTILGGVIGTIVFGAVTYVAFGAHIPDLGTQGSLVTNLGLPNLLGLALGQGGETTTLREILMVVLVLAVLLCCIFAWRGGGDFITFSGWASLALLVTLAWVLPWYVVWVLPFTALTSSRRLRIATALFSVYITLAWVPATSSVLSAIGFKPESTALGQVHTRYTDELLN
ncbi:MAG: hypothetical protein ACYCU0_04395 [Solirubrobacteraceae bacterium]